MSSSSSASLGIMALRSLLKANAKDEFRKLNESLFPKEEEVKFYQWIRKHLRNHKKLPSLVTARAHGFEMPKTEEPAEYYLDRLYDRGILYAIQSRQEMLAKAMATGDMKKALAICREQVQAAMAVQNPDEFATLAKIAKQEVLRDYFEMKFSGDLPGITTGWPTMDRDTLGLNGGDLFTFAGRPGLGKAQPLTAKIKTPEGWVRMGQVHEGQVIESPDGKPSRVIAIYPQGERDVYRVTFKDGRVAECCDEHLWTVECSRWTQRTQTLTTLQVREALTKARNKGRIGVPLVVGDSAPDRTLSVDPYLLGVLIGDGCLTREVKFSTTDDEIVASVRRLIPFGVRVRRLSGCDYAIVTSRSARVSVGRRTEFKHVLTEMGLLGKKAHEKTVPSDYMEASRTQRLALLQGLLDTDGTAGKNGSVQYCTTSYQLAKQVQTLVWSLGGVSRIAPKRTRHRDAYVVSIRYREPSDLFRLTRKKNRVSQYQYRDSLKNVIVSVEWSRREQCQCIAVSHDSKLYVTDDYVVTHNTWRLLFMARAAWIAGFSPLVCSNEMLNPALVRRVLGLHSGINPRAIRSGKLQHWTEKKLIQVIDALDDMPPFYLVAGRFNKTVGGIERLIEYLQPDGAYLDAAYLFKAAVQRRNSSQSDDLAENIHAIKDVSQTYNIPSVITVQFNRNVDTNAKGAKRRNPANAELDLNYLAKSDAMGQDSDAVYGIRPRPAPHEKTQSTNVPLKIREGDTDAAPFIIHTKSAPMNFNELTEEELQTIEANDDEDESLSESMI